MAAEQILYESVPREDGGEILTEDIKSHLSDRCVREEWAPVVDPDRFDEQVKRAVPYMGERDRDHIRRCCEMSLETISRMIERQPLKFAQIAEMLVPNLAKEGMLGEATSVSNIGTFRNWMYPLVREIWPNLAPLAAMIGIQNQPIPSAHLPYLYTYATDAGSFYTAGSRLVNQNDPNYADYTCGDEPNEVELRMSTTTVDAEPKALLARMDICAVQDAMSQYGLSLPSELQALIAKEIAREYVGEVRDNLIGSANGGTVTWYTTAAASSEYTKDSNGIKRWQETLYDAVADVEELIYQKVYRKVGWLWVSTDVAKRMKKAGRFEFRGDGAVDDMGGGVDKVTEYFGTVDGLWKVFCDADAAANTCLCGVSPRSWLETGYILGIYIALMFVGPFTDPADLSPRLAGLTRRSQKLISGAFYGKVVPTARP